MTIVSAGEILWDVIGEAEHLGGAPFNLAAHARLLGHNVLFVSAVGAEERGRRVLERMAELGLSTRFVHALECQQTGTVSVSLDASGQPRFTIHRPAAYDFAELAPDEITEVASAAPDWIAFGTLQQTSAQARRLTARLLDAAPQARRFYDVNLRPGCYTPELVRELMGQATVVKLNETEAEEISEMLGKTCTSPQQFCERNAARFGWEAVAITRAERGCAAWIGGDYVEAPGYKVKVADAVGAGDAFAAAFLHGLSTGWPPAQVADFANRVGGLVASRPGAVPEWTVEEAQALG